MCIRDSGDTDNSNTVWVRTLWVHSNDYCFCCACNVCIYSYGEWNQWTATSLSTNPVCSRSVVFPKWKTLFVPLIWIVVTKQYLYVLDKYLRCSTVHTYEGCSKSFEPNLFRRLPWWLCGLICSPVLAVHDYRKCWGSTSSHARKIVSCGKPHACFEINLSGRQEMVQLCHL